MNIENKDLKRRIIDISYKHKLSHLSSCLTAVGIIQMIHDVKDDYEPFVLSAGHAGLALYVVLESLYPRCDAEVLLERCGIHPSRELDDEFIDCSSGSLGHGIGIAVGMALADRSKDVYCLISDGELAEGSVHESIRIADELKLTNLKLYVNWNGYAAYKETNEYDLPSTRNIQINCVRTNIDYLPFLQGLKGHYKVMNEEEYKLAMEVLK